MAASKPIINNMPLARSEKEFRLRQFARAIWLFGLSGAGKNTLAAGLIIESAGTLQAG